MTAHAVLDFSRICFLAYDSELLMMILKTSTISWTTALSHKL